MKNKLLSIILCILPTLSGGVILEVGESSGPGGLPAPRPIASLPYAFTLTLTAMGTINGCLDAEGLNETCWYLNDTGSDWSSLAIRIAGQPDISCGGDIFASGCNEVKVGPDLLVQLKGGSIKNGGDFHFFFDGWDEGQSITLVAGVPEPASWLLIWFSVVGFGGYAWRHSRRLRSAS